MKSKLLLLADAVIFSLIFFSFLYYIFGNFWILIWLGVPVELMVVLSIMPLLPSTLLPHCVPIAGAPLLCGASALFIDSLVLGIVVVLFLNLLHLRISKNVRIIFLIIAVLSFAITIYGYGRASAQRVFLDHPPKGATIADCVSRYPNDDVNILRCQTGIAKNQKDYKLCDALQGVVGQLYEFGFIQLCKMGVAGALEDINFCKELHDPRSPLQVNCFAVFAAKYNDFSICEQISDPWIYTKSQAVNQCEYTAKSWRDNPSLKYMYE